MIGKAFSDKRKAATRPSLKGSNTIAQGNALGRGAQGKRLALKGRDNPWGTNGL